MNHAKTLFATLWFDWLSITALYVLTFYGSGNTASAFYVLNPIIGLFVPIGWWNLLAMFQPSSPATLPATSYAWIYVLPLLFGLFFARRVFDKTCASKFWLRILLNLGLLFLATMCVDFIIWHEWKSWELFAQSVFSVTNGRIDVSVL
jgi:hypothetical protein